MLLDGCAHIIWDWNGTLLDDLSYTLECVNQMLARRSLRQLELEEFRERFSFPVEAFYRQVGFDVDRETFGALSHEWGSLYEENKHICRLHNQVPETLQTLTELKLGQSILSAYPQTQLHETVSHYGLKPYFTHVVGHENFQAPGKIPQARWLQQQLGVPAQKLGLIGDTVHDAEVAEALGMRCILVSSGYNSAARLLGTGHAVLESLSQLLD